MAVDIWPYSQRDGGRVSDIEHERLSLGDGDGILPDEPSTALAVSFGGGWEVQPGRIRIAGHVLDIDAAVSGSLPTAPNATQTCVVAAYIDHAASPWTYGVELVQGTPGSGRPDGLLTRDLTGRYRVPLRAVTIAPNGAVTGRWDERPRLDRHAGVRLPAVAERDEADNFVMSGDEWGYHGTPRCSTSFVAPPSGEVTVTVYARTETHDNTASAVVSWELRKDDHQGAVVRGPWQDDGVTNRAAAVAASTTKYVSGLEPYRTYYITTMHRMTNTTTSSDVRHRRITVVPLR